jgi:hypothetical protein
MKKLLICLALICASGASHAQVKVNALPNGAIPGSGDYTICDQSSNTNKCTFAQVLAYIQAQLNLTAIPAFVANDCLSNNGTALLWTATCGGGGGGGVSSVSVVTANGFSASVATPTTTPAITLNTTFTGIGYSNGTGFAAAVAGNFPTLNQNTTGNAATATLATTATNLAGGTANQFPYQTGAGATTFGPAPTVSSTFLEWTGSAFQWATPTGSGTVNSGTAGQLAYYQTSTNAVYGATVGAGLALNSGIVTTSNLVNAQTGTTYTIVSGDSAKLLTLSNAAAVAVSLPVATTSGFGGGWGMDTQNLGAGLVTITPTTSTIDGYASLIEQQGLGCSITSDGTNYQVNACPAIADGQTKFTAVGTGCTIGATVGRGSSGTFTLAAGPCTSVVITMNGATGLAAQDGWTCQVRDRTTQAAGTWIPTWGETTSTTTTATLPIPAAAGSTDVIAFNCVRF